MSHTSEVIKSTRRLKNTFSVFQPGRIRNCTLTLVLRECLPVAALSASVNLPLSVSSFQQNSYVSLIFIPYFLTLFNLIKSSAREYNGQMI